MKVKITEVRNLAGTIDACLIDPSQPEGQRLLLIAPLDAIINRCNEYGWEVTNWKEVVTELLKCR